MKQIFIFIIAGLLSNAVHAQDKILFTTSDYVRALKHATDVMVTDVASPVAASRYYAYINLAATEAAAVFDKQQHHFVGIVRGLNTISINDTLVAKSDPQLAIILAVYKSSVKLLPSGYLLHTKVDSLTLVAKRRHISPDKIEATKSLVDKWCTVLNTPMMMICQT